MRPLQCPRSRAGWLPSSAYQLPCGPLLTGLGPLLRLGESPRAKGAGTSGPRSLACAWRGAGRRECGCPWLPPSLPSCGARVPFSAPHPGFSSLHSWLSCAMNQPQIP